VGTRAEVCWSTCSAGQASSVAPIGARPEPEATAAAAAAPPAAMVSAASAAQHAAASGARRHWVVFMNLAPRYFA